MTAKEKTEIDKFLRILQSTSRGCAFIVNMFDSCTQKLVSPEILGVFLLDCAYTLEASPSVNAVNIVEDVSQGYGLSKRNYLRQCKQRLPAKRIKYLSNTINSVSFHKFILDAKYKAGATALPIVLPPKPSSTPFGLREYQERLSEITADSTWKNPIATIGKPLPQPSNCWITTDYLGKDAHAPKYPHALATEIRDQLGLIDYGDDCFLLRLSFLTSSLAKISDNELARPVFSDLGNSRFRVHQSSKRAARFAKQGWGATTHLGRFGNKKFRHLTGACERISSALPLSALEDLTVEFLGRVTEDRGKGIHDNDEAYAKELLAKRTPLTIKNALLSLFK